jgi:acyl-coenzyme A synthetase/AMP-(fatty) acid ligase
MAREESLRTPGTQRPADPSHASDELAKELIHYCRERVAAFKCPRSIDFVDDVPRLPTGKLLKRVLRDRNETAG